MAETNGRDLMTVGIVVLAVLLLWPVLMMLGFGGMGMGYGGMMGGPYGGTGGFGWLGLAVRVAFLLAILGGGYFVVRRFLEDGESNDAARAELRRAYARGDLSDEEFETRRSKLRSDE